MNGSRSPSELERASASCSTVNLVSKKPTTPASNAEPVLQPTSLPNDNDAPTPEWLTAWLHLPRLLVISDDLPQILDPHKRDLAILILQRIRSSGPIDFRYLSLLFTTAPDAIPPGAGDTNPLYLLSRCLVRNAPRNFRLGRMQVDSRESNSAAFPFPLLPPPNSY